MIMSISVKGQFKFLRVFLFGVVFGTSLAGQSAEEMFHNGLEALQYRKTDEAIAYFIKASELEPMSPDYFFYLGLSQHQAGQLSNAELSYTKSLSLGGNRDTVLFRRGNLRWAAGNTEDALDDFIKVVEEGGPSKSAALLNRANLELNQSLFEQAVQDYKSYLAREPGAPDRANIEKIIALLTAEAEAARVAEAKRLAEEARKAEEEAKRAALMSDLLDSLEGTGQDTKSKTAGTESIHSEFEESSLEE